MWLLVCFIIFSSFLLYSKASAEVSILAICNASDGLMVLIELATESGDDYVVAKAVLVERLLDYADYIKERDLNWLPQFPLFSNKNTVKELEHLAKYFEIAEIYAINPNVAYSMTLCMANRKSIVYLYLVRFGHQEIVSKETLKQFRSDINRTIYYNKVLQQTYDMKNVEVIENSAYKRFDNYSDSELRRLWLLQAIIDNDIQQTQVLLQIALTAQPLFVLSSQKTIDQFINESNGFKARHFHKFQIVFFKCNRERKDDNKIHNITMSLSLSDT